MAFLRSDIGRALLIAAAAVALLLYVYGRGVAVGEDRGRAALLEAQLAAAQRDRDVAAAAAADEAMRATSLETRIRTWEAIVDEQREALADLADDDRCVWDPDQLERVRDILRR